MTREEAIEILKDLWRYEHSKYSEKEIREALEKGIKALENQKSIIEELKTIKAEIDESSFEAYEKYSEEPIFCNYTLNIMQIIDNHIEELKGELNNENNNNRGNRNP